MLKFRLEIVTAEKIVYSDEVDVVVAPGIEGQLGILAHHAPLMTMLQPGELIVKKDRDEVCMAITGGFLEVRPDKVVILADAAEKAEEIDISRAEAARCKAIEAVGKPGIEVAKAAQQQVDLSLAEAALKRALVRLKVAERRKKRPH